MLSSSAISSSSFLLYTDRPIPRQVLPYEAIDILLGASLPWAVRVAEVGGGPGVLGEFGVLRHPRP